MPSQPLSSQPLSSHRLSSHPGPSQLPSSPPREFPLASKEWALLVTLPRRVLIAATSAERDSAKHTVAEGLAGIEAIAAGRASPSRLVHDVVAAIYAEPDLDDAPTAEEFTDPEVGIAGVLADCRLAARLLADRVPRADAGAYRDWLTDIATAVCSAARTGGIFGFGAVTVSPAERRFLDELNGCFGS
jgi:hypothetical protein